MKRQLLSAICALLASATLCAHDFTVTVGNGKLYFNITDAKAATAELTYEGSITNHSRNTIQGEVRIPATVRHDGKVYTINAIGAKALDGASDITSVILPATVRTVGDFAFQGCTALTSIVFPGSQVTFGQGAFFRCTAIRNISLGSDWTQADFRMFRWSDSLQVVSIPARIQKIQGLKSLRGLRQINVDANNPRYAAEAGCLYDKSSATLLCVPRAYTGKLDVREGTTSILWGAAIDCTGITDIVLPASMQKLSFREFSRMANLQTITCRTPQPIATAHTVQGDATVFAVANDKVRLFVAKPALKAWKKAMPTQGADFAEIAANKPAGTADIAATTPYTIATSQLIAQRNIKAYK